MTEVKNLQGEVIQEHNTFAPNKPNATWVDNPNVAFGDYPKNKFDWSQMFQLDTQQGADFMEGFKDENFVAMAIDNYLNPPPHFTADPTYMVTKDDDPSHRWHYLNDQEYYSQATSHDHFDYLVTKRKEMMTKIESQPSYIAGRIFGGVMDVSNVFLATRMAVPLYQTSKIKRAVNTSTVLGVEEFGKQLIDEDRTKEEGYAIIGGNFILNMLLPRFKGLTQQDKKLVDSFIKHNDIVDEKNSIINATKIEIIEGPTLKYRNAEGKTIKLKEGELPPKGYEEVGAFRAVENGVMKIYINPKKIALDFKNKAWTKPKTKGVNPLPENQFKTVEEYQEFVMNHEKAHTYIDRLDGESTASYENRINQHALTRKETIPFNKFEQQKYLANETKYMEELELERFQETVLKSMGESSNWNPIQRLVNTGNLTAIKFGKQILHSPLLTKGNFEGIPNTHSLEQWLKADNKVYGYTIMDIQKLYKKYKTNNSNPIPFKEFNQRITLSLLDDNYVDDIAEVMSGKVKAKEYYNYIGKKIKDSEVRLNEQEMLIGTLQKRLGESQGKQVVITMRLRNGTKQTKKYSNEEFKKLIDDEINFLEQLKKNPLRKNYVNRFVNIGKIQNNIEAWRVFATASLKRSNPTFSDEVINGLVRSYEEKLPWQKFDAVDLSKSADDVTIEKYFFSPSGVSGNLKRRGNFVLDQQEWIRAGYMEGDIFALMQVYHKSVLPDTYLGSIFGTANAHGGAFLQGKRYQAGIRDVASEYEVKFNNAKTKAEKSKITDERNAVIKDMEAVRDLFKGVYGVPDDPTKFWSKGIRLTKQFNAWTSLQGATASLVDMGRSLFYNGLQRSLSTTFESFSNGITKDIWKISLKEARMSGEGFDMLLSTRALAYNDLDTIYGTLDKIERGANKMSGVFFMANLMSPWNQMIKTHNTMMIVTRLLEESENLVNGTITKLNKAKLAQSGIGLKEAKRILKQYENHGQGKGSLSNDAGLEHIRLAKSFDWMDEEIQKVFNLAVQNDVNLAIVTPSLADTPLWMSTEIGGLIAQFKKFTMGMSNRVLIRGLQEKDANFFGTIVTMIALGMIVDQLRARAFDMDYSQMSNAQKFKNGFERSGVGGYFTDTYTALERLIFGDMGQKMGAIGGPTGSQLDKMQHVLFDNNPESKASNVRRLVPFQNIHYLDSLFDQMEKGLQ